MSWTPLAMEFAALCLAIAVSSLVPMPRGRRLLSGYLCLAAVAWLIAAWVQKRGYAYQLLPAVELADLTLVVALIEVVGNKQSPGRPGLSRLAVAGAILTAGAFVSLRPITETMTFARYVFQNKPLIRNLHDLAAGRPVLLLTGGFQFGVPSLANVQLGSRAPSQILLPGIVDLPRAMLISRRRRSGWLLWQARNWLRTSIVTSRISWPWTSVPADKPYRTIFRSWISICNAKTFGWHGSTINRSKRTVGGSFLPGCRIASSTAGRAARLSHGQYHPMLRNGSRE